MNAEEAHSSSTSAVSNPCLDDTVVMLASRSVVVICPIAVDPTIAIGVPALDDSASDNKTLYMVTLHVPAVPLAPLSLTFPPLMSAVNVASGVDSAFVMIRLNSVMKALVPSCTTITSVEETSLVVVLFMDMKYLAPLKSAAANVSRLAAAESRSATNNVCCCVNVELPACVPDESLSPSPILKKCSVFIEESVDQSDSFLPAPNNLNLLFASLMSVP